jgi:hypothetical protein
MTARLPLQAGLNTTVGLMRSQITALDRGGSIEQFQGADGFPHGRTGAGYDLQGPGQFQFPRGMPQSIWKSQPGMRNHFPNPIHHGVRNVLHTSRTRFHVCHLVGRE